MCSRNLRRLPALLVGIALGLSLMGCGHKDDPQPPPQKIPEPIRDLEVTQRGSELIVSFTYPQVTISGLPIDDIVAIEFWEYEIAVPELIVRDDDDEETSEELEDAQPESDTEPSEETPPPAPEPEESEPQAVEDEGELDDEGEDEGAAPVATTSKEALLEVDPREFAGASRLRHTLAGATLSSAVSGPEVEFRLPLDQIEPGEKTALVFAVKSFQSLKRASAFSNLVKIIPRVAPDPPTEVELEATRNGVKLSWLFEGEEPLEFRFYRRDRLAPIFADHFGIREGDGDRFLDGTAQLGNSYSYAISAVINRTPLVESELSKPVEIEFVDTFPPETPDDLVVLTEVGTARLLWEGSPDVDVAGYAIYRRTGSGEFERLNQEPLRQNEYRDTTAASGRTYTYRVVAIDHEGNASDPSEEVEVRIP